MVAFSMVLTILSNLFYHITQKNVPEGLNPAVSLIVTYGVALFCSFLLYPLFSSGDGFLRSFSGLNGSSFLLGLAIVGLELGFLLAYRAGWGVSIAALFSNVCVTLLLIPMGILLFKEEVSVRNVVGVIVCLAGLALIKS